MDEKPSNRLVDQRIRNRIIESVETLADGDDGVREVGTVDYFESFYDWIPHRDHGGMPSYATITDDERTLLLELSSILDNACDATSRHVNDDELIATGWPRRIQPVASRALRLMRRRGQFSEEQEEDVPSN